jgi:hypothetical protein
LFKSQQYDFELTWTTSKKFQQWTQKTISLAVKLTTVIVVVIVTNELRKEASTSQLIYYWWK